MKVSAEKKPSPIKWVKDVERLAQRAVRDAIQQHFKAGNPVWVMKDGRMVKLVGR